MKNNSLSIRPFDPQSLPDYAALAKLYKYAYPEEQITATGLRFADGMRPAHLVSRRWLSEENGVINGVGAFEHWAEFYEPDKYLLHVIVAPQHQGQGTGTRLYDLALAEMAELQPRSMRIWARQDLPAGIAFAEKRGFEKVKIKWNILLDVQTANIEQFAPHVAAVKEGGITIHPWSDFVGENELVRKLYDLHVRTVNGIENVDRVLIPEFDEFVEKQRNVNDELLFVARQNNELVAMWQLENSAPGALFGGILGVDKTHRKSGVAIALVVQSIAYAKRYGFSTLVAYTAEYNKPTLTLAEKMGFRHLPPQILFSKNNA